MSTQTPSAPRYCTIEDAAITLALSRDTIRRMIRTGELEAVRIRKSVRISIASLDAVGKSLTVEGAR